MFCNISTKDGLTMTYNEWIHYLDTLTINEIKNIYWSEFNAKGRKSLNFYLKKRSLSQRNLK